jgi:hypothetical protein
MPRFMVVIKGNSQSEAGIQPSARLAEQMDAYNEQRVRAGVRLSAEGLEPSSKGARITFKGGRGAQQRTDFQMSSVSPPVTSPCQDHFGICKPSGTSSAEWW